MSRQFELKIQLLERDAFKVALEKIVKHCHPGKTVGVDEAIELICDVYDIASSALVEVRRENQQE